METPGTILLVISAAISFGIGRLFVYFRDKKRKAATDEAQKRAALVLKDQPPEPESRNKAKRKRQLRDANRDGPD
jgi:cell division protein FtsN